MLTPRTYMHSHKTGSYRVVISQFATRHTDFLLSMEWDEAGYWHSCTNSHTHSYTQTHKTHTSHSCIHTHTAHTHKIYTCIHTYTRIHNTFIHATNLCMQHIHAHTHTTHVHVYYTLICHIHSMNWFSTKKDGAEQKHWHWEGWHQRDKGKAYREHRLVLHS